LLVLYFLVIVVPFTSSNTLGEVCLK